MVPALASRSRRLAVTSACLLSSVCLCLVAGCGGGSSSRRHTVGTTVARPLVWQPFVRDRGVLDLSSPLPGSAAIRVAARGRLQTLSGRQLRPFSPGYAASPGLESYIALSSGQSVAGAGCRFPPDALYALRLTQDHGITVIGQSGHVRRFAALHSAGLEDGITFDLIGRFGHRLLVTTYAKKVGTTVSTIDCRGRVRVLTRHAPRVEGGIAVAPSSFGPYAGDLIAPNELTGNIYAISPTGHASLIGNSAWHTGRTSAPRAKGSCPLDMRMHSYPTEAPLTTPTPATTRFWRCHNDLSGQPAWRPGSPGRQ